MSSFVSYCPQTVSESQEKEQVEIPINNKVQQKKTVLFVKNLNGRLITLEFERQDTVLKIKRLLQNILEGHLDEIRLIFAGRQLDDGRTLGDYNIRDTDTLHILSRLRGD